MTTQSESEQFETTAQPPSNLEATEASQIESIPAKDETASEPPQDVRTVPVLSEYETIKLRYAPRKANPGQPDSSTQT
jgi:hypothetical protein